MLKHFISIKDKYSIIHVICETMFADHHVSFLEEPCNNQVTCRRALHHLTAMIINCRVNALETNYQALMPLLIHPYNKHIVIGAIAVFLWISLSNYRCLLDGALLIHVFSESRLLSHGYV